MLCPICKNSGHKIFRGKVLKKYEIQYFQCHVCGFVYTEEPYWLDEAYMDPIVNIDTGMMKRTMDNVLLTNVLVKKFYSMENYFLDYGGGYGVFTRMMRDLGYDWVWYDKFSKNLMACGFEYDGKRKPEMITAFELFEHFDRPMEEISHLLSLSDTILFSTLIYAHDLVYKELDKWWYYSPEAGQHISFYSQRTLEFIADKFRIYYYRINDGKHLFTKKKINPLCLKLLSTKGSSILQFFYYWRQRKHGLAYTDMETLLNLNS